MTEAIAPQPSSPQPPQRKRRSACGCLLSLILIVLVAAVAVVSFFLLRQNPEPPLKRWIPLKAELAANVKVDFSRDAYGGLLDIALNSDKSISPAQRQQITSAVQQLFGVALYPKMLLVARVEPSTLELKWAIVGNLRRGQTLLAPLTKQFLGDEVKWTDESAGGKRLQRIQAPSFDIQGVLDGTQLILSDNREWLEEVRTNSAATQPPLPLERVTANNSQISVAIEDTQGNLRRLLADMAQDMADPEIAVGSAHLLRLLNETNGSADVEGAILVKSAKGTIIGGGRTDFQAQTINAAAADLQKQLSDSFDLPNAKMAQAVTYKGKHALQVEIPAFGFMLGQSLQP